MPDGRPPADAARLADLERRLAELDAQRAGAEETLRRQERTLAVLRETAEALLRRRDPKGLLEDLLARAAELVGARHGYVALVEGDGVVIRLGLGAFADAAGWGQTRGQGVDGTVWETGRALAINDYRSWPTRSRDPRASRFTAIAGTP